jgi:hypothetical protein
VTIPVDATLRQLDTWYRAVLGDGDKPALLCKLAMMELCGWLEQRMDVITREAATCCGVGTSGELDLAIRDTFGFHYKKHFRPLIAVAIGEVGVVDAEGRFDAASPGDLEHLKSLLGTLWDLRSTLAHTTMASPIPIQVTKYAPSWSLNQWKQLNRLLVAYEAAAKVTATKVKGALP